MAGTQSSELSERELEILRLIATGVSNKEIAQELDISTNTVKVHLRNIFGKIGVASRTEAAMQAVRWGLVPAVSGSIFGDHSLGRVGSLNQAKDLNTVSPSQAISPSPELPAIPLTQSRFRIYRYRWWAVIGFCGLVILLVSMIFWFRRLVLTATSPNSINYPQPPRMQELAPLPTARLDMATISYENKVYAIAGLTDQGVTGAVECYDPRLDSWEERSPKPIAVSEVSAVVIRGLIYVPGGRLDTGALTQVMEVYNPPEDRWETRASLPVPLSAYGLVAYEGRIYLFGGWDGRQYLKTVYIYDPSRDSWSQGTPMPGARAFAGAVVVLDKIYIIGGLDGNNVLSTNDIFSPNREGIGTNLWSTGKSLPEKRYAMGIASIADIIVVMGGKGNEKGNIVLRSLEYRQEVDQWQQIGSLIPDYWSNLSLVTLGTQMYVIGGIIDGDITTRNLAYQAIYTFSLPLIR